MKKWLKEFYTFQFQYENVTTFQGGRFKGMTIDEALDSLNEQELKDLYNSYQC